MATNKEDREALVQEVVSAVAEGESAKRSSRSEAAWKALAVVLVVSVLAVVLVADGAARSSSTAVAPEAVISADMAGVQTTIDELRAAGAERKPKIEHPEATVEAATRRHRRGLGPTSQRRAWEVEPPALSAPAKPAPEPTCEDCEEPHLAGFEKPTRVLWDEDGGYTVIRALRDEPEARLTVGTRFKVALCEPVLTGVDPSPVSAELVEDLVAGGRRAVLAGARLEGAAVAVITDNRVRILFSALVSKGAVVEMLGLALNARNEVGVGGILVKKGSKKRRVAGKLGRSLGVGLSFGLSGVAGGVAGAAARELGRGVANDGRELAEHWSISDKQVRLPAGTEMVVYLRQSLVVS